MRIRMALVIASLLLAACSGGDPGSDGTARTTSTTFDVYVVNYPLRYFAERIGGERVTVHFPAPPDGDPALWTPDATAIARFQRADLILVNGSDYSDWIAKSTLPLSAIVDTTSSFADRYIPLENAVTHSHGPEGDHEHGGYAFTTWLDPLLAIEQARAIAAAFSRKQPGHETEFQTKLTALEEDLAALDDRFAATAKMIGNRPLIFSHPVYQYLERRYGLDGRSLHWEPEQPPDLSELARLRAGHPANWLIWERRPGDAAVAELEQAGVSSAVFVPCANEPLTGDYLTVMRENAAVLERVATDSRP